MLKINIEISENVDGLTPIEKAILSALAGGVAPLAEIGEVKVSAPAPVEEETDTPAEPEKPKPRTRRTKAQIEADRTAQEVEADKEAEAIQEVEAKTLQEELAEDDAELTMEDVVAAATVIVGAGRQTELKKVLEDLNTPRVSKLAKKDFAPFMEAIKELG